MLTIIFRIILTIVHYVYANIEKVKSRLKYARLSCAKIYRRLRFGSKCDIRVARSETLRLKQIVENIDKLPVHLCVLLGAGDEERIEFSHLARILRWSVIAGIPYVSFYDQDGFLKRNERRLRDECDESSATEGERPDRERKINWSKAGENGCDGIKKCNTRVQIFSYQDGKGETVKLARLLSRAVSHGLLKIEEIDIELLNDKLRLKDTPEPDLALVCAPALCTFGFLPWHIKTTEFHNFSSHREVTITDFSLVLEKYGRCQQRYGK